MFCPQRWMRLCTGRMQGKGGTKSVCGLIQNERCREIDLPEVAARTLAATRRRNERTMRKAKCPTPMRPTLGVGYVQATQGGLGRAVWGKRCAHSLSWSPSRRRLNLRRRGCVLPEGIVPTMRSQLRLRGMRISRKAASAREALVTNLRGID